MAGCPMRRVMLLTMVLLCLAVPALAQHPYALVLTPEALDDALDDGGGRFIDLRSEKAFNQMHIPGFENIPFKEADVLALADCGEPLYLFCAQGKTSAAAYNLLLSAGAAEVHACVFGFAQYAESMGEEKLEGANICLPCLALEEREEEE